MKLSHFIKAHIEEILTEWESFAWTLHPPTSDLTVLALRDRARQILESIALDIETVESPEQQYKKSQGKAPELAGGGESAASMHGTEQQAGGFSLVQLVAEYRALRATVLRLWLPRIALVTPETSNDMMRFNETIDQALAESAATYTNRAARTRDTFLAMLGHDLRSPLAAMTLAGDFLSMQNLGQERMNKVGVQIKRSAATMTTMVNDLLQYARTQLGGELPIERHQANMREICQSALNDASAAHPDCMFSLEASGELIDFFDSVRLNQVFANLLNNAAQYRTKDHPVTMLAQGELGAIVVQVKNRGPIIPPESLEAIFNPLIQLPQQGDDTDQPSTSIGLGLFIAREITVAHGGTIWAESNEISGTVFTVRLPRMQQALH